MSDFSRPAEDILKDAKEYVDLRADGLKLQAARGLTDSVSKILSLILIIVVLFAFVLVISFALVLLLGEWIKSYALAAFIVAGVHLLVLVVLFLLKDKLFHGSFSKMFMKIFFQDEDRCFDEKALEENQKACLKKEELLKRKVSKAKEIYTPANLVSEGIHRTVGSVPFYGGVLTLLSALRKFKKR